jgi:signal peptidase I
MPRAVFPTTHAKVLAASLLLILAVHAQDRYELRSIPEEAALMEPSVKRRSFQVFRTDGSLPPRGAVVWFEHPALPARMHVSRVVGRPGDRVHLARGRVVRGGQPLSEDQVEKRLEAEEIAEVVVPEGHLYLANDVRGDPGSPAADSRRLGPVPAALVVGWTRDRVAEREPDPEGPPRRGAPEGRRP